MSNKHYQDQGPNGNGIVNTIQGEYGQRGSYQNQRRINRGRGEPVGRGRGDYNQNVNDQSFEEQRGRGNPKVGRYYNGNTPRGTQRQSTYIEPPPNSRYRGRRYDPNFVPYHRQRNNNIQPIYQQQNAYGNAGSGIKREDEQYEDDLAKQAYDEQQEYVDSKAYEKERLTKRINDDFLEQQEAKEKFKIKHKIKNKQSRTKNINESSSNSDSDNESSTDDDIEPKKNTKMITINKSKYKELKKENEELKIKFNDIKEKYKATKQGNKTLRKDNRMYIEECNREKIITDQQAIKAIRDKYREEFPSGNEDGRTRFTLKIMRDIGTTSTSNVCLAESIINGLSQQAMKRLASSECIVEVLKSASQEDCQKIVWILIESLGSGHHREFFKTLVYEFLPTNVLNKLGTSMIKRCYEIIGSGGNTEIPYTNAINELTKSKNIESIRKVGEKLYNEQYGHQELQTIAGPSKKITPNKILHNESDRTTTDSEKEDSGTETSEGAIKNNNKKRRRRNRNHKKNTNKTGKYYTDSDEEDSEEKQRPKKRVKNKQENIKDATRKKASSGNKGKEKDQNKNVDANAKAQKSSNEGCLKNVLLNDGETKTTDMELTGLIKVKMDDDGNDYKEGQKSKNKDTISPSESEEIDKSSIPDDDNVPNEEENMALMVKETLNNRDAQQESGKWNKIWHRMGNIKYRAEGVLEAYEEIEQEEIWIRDEQGERVDTINKKIILPNGKEEFCYKTIKCGLNQETKNLETIKCGCTKKIQGPDGLLGKATVLGKRDDSGHLDSDFEEFEIRICASCFKESEQPSDVTEVDNVEL